MSEVPLYMGRRSVAERVGIWALRGRVAFGERFGCLLVFLTLEPRDE